MLALTSGGKLKYLTYSVAGPLSPVQAEHTCTARFKTRRQQCVLFFRCYTTIKTGAHSMQRPSWCG